MKHLTWPACAGALLLAGCAADTTKIESEYVSPDFYAGFDCAQVGAEFARLTRRAEDVGATVDRTASDDQAQAVVGIVLFWPALLFLEGGETPQTREYARLKGQIEALEATSVKKGCAVDLRQAAQSPAAGSTTANVDALQVLYRDGVITEDEYVRRRAQISESKAREEIATIEASKRVAAVTPDTGSAAPAAAAAPVARRLAILPLNDVNTIYATPLQASVVKRDLMDRLWRRLEVNKAVEVVYSTQSPDYNNPGIEDLPRRFWKGGPGTAPNDAAVYRAGESLGADLALLIGWVRTPGSNELTAYVYDVRAHRVYRRKGRNNSPDTVEHVDGLLDHTLREALAAAP